MHPSQFNCVITDPSNGQSATSAALNHTLQDPAVHPQRFAVFPQGQTPYDTVGSIAKSHDGWIVYDPALGLFTMLGEDVTETSGALYGFTSPDLLNWTSRGAVAVTASLPANYASFSRGRHWLDAATGKWFVAFHLYNNPNNPNFVCVLRSDSGSMGPYNVVTMAPTLVNGQNSKDIGILQDSDGSVYLFAALDNASVVKFNAGFTGFVGTPSALPFNGEAFAPFKAGATYYLILSGQTGWLSNPNGCLKATSPTGPYSWCPNPFDSADAPTPGNTYNCQCNQVLKLPGGDFVFLGDRWNGGNLYSQKVMLPLYVDLNGNPYVPWVDSFVPDVAVAARAFHPINGGPIR